MNKWHIIEFKSFIKLNTYTNRMGYLPNGHMNPDGIEKFFGEVEKMVEIILLDDLNKSTYGYKNSVSAKVICGKFFEIDKHLRSEYCIHGLNDVSFKNLLAFQVDFAVTGSFAMPSGLPLLIDVSEMAGSMQHTITKVILAALNDPRAMLIPSTCITEMQIVEVTQANGTGKAWINTQDNDMKVYGDYIPEIKQPNDPYLEGIKQSYLKKWGIK